jgi:hypothetical protein
MAWEKAESRWGRDGVRLRDPAVAVYSTGELYVNRIAVNKFGVKPGRVDFVIDRERKKIGIKMSSRGRWTLFKGSLSSVRVVFGGVLKQLEIPRPNKKKKIYSTVSREDGMLVFSYKDWE